jgi:hypothetical protein
MTKTISQQQKLAFGGFLLVQLITGVTRNLL